MAERGLRASEASKPITVCPGESSQHGEHAEMLAPAASLDKPNRAITPRRVGLAAGESGNRIRPYLIAHFLRTGHQ